MFVHRNLLSCPIKVNLTAIKVQRQVARFIYNDFYWNSSVSNMLHQLDLPMLAYHRDKAEIIFLYKIDLEVVDITLPESYLRPNSRDTRGHPLKFTPNYLQVLIHFNTRSSHQQSNSGIIYHQTSLNLNH